jgi:hypothetical protein
VRRIAEHRDIIRSEKAGGPLIAPQVALTHEELCPISNPVEITSTRFAKNEKEMERNGNFWLSDDIKETYRL